MNIRTVSLALLLLSRDAYSQITHRDLLQKKYAAETIAKMIPAPGEWKPFPQTPEEWKRILPDTTIAQLIANGERLLKRNFPGIPATIALDFTRNGNRTRYEELSFDKRNVLMDLVLAESMEGKGRFTDHIIDGIWSICEETFWGVSAHVGLQKAGVGLPDVQDPVVDLFAAETAADLAWTDYFVGPQLDKVSRLVRQRIGHEMDRRIFIPMTTAKYGWMGNGNPGAKLNNWAPWIMSNYLVANLLLQKDKEKREQGINTVLRITDQYIDGLGEDGGCEEGPTYWSAAGGAVFDILNILNDASKGSIDIYNEPIIQKMGAYIYKTHIAGKYFVNVADAHPQFIPDGVLIYRFGAAVHDKQMTGLGAWAYHTYGNSFATGNDMFRKTRVIYNLLAEKDMAKKSNTSYADIGEAWLPDVQLLTAHLPNGLFLSAHGGTNGESHNHNDVGDFTVYANGDPVIIDVGSGTYTAKTFSKDRYAIWYNTSSFHNLPVINGVQQQEGLRFAASNVSWQGGAEQKDGRGHKQTGSKDHKLTMDIEKAYPEMAYLAKWRRTITLSRSGTIGITDDYSVTTPLQSLTQTFMTVAGTDLTTPGKILFTTEHGTKVQLTYDASFWDVKKEKMDLVTPEDQGLKDSWEHKDIYRIVLTAKGNAAATTLCYTISKI
jgi:hypothetical protein